jgi:GTPase SAR1 family protein
MSITSQLPTQNKFCGFAMQLQTIMENANISQALQEKTAALESSMKNQELVIPVVGTFSSGKSTMLNTLMGNKLLPTKITPETSLAMELHNGTDPHIDVILEDGSTQRFALNSIKEITDKAGNYCYGKLYTDNPALKSIDPIVLVDMPGFEAPIAKHNTAIEQYIIRGCHYIILCDVNEGTITQSLLRRMREIDSYGRRFSFFLSKCNLKPESEVNEILQESKEILEDVFDYPIHVGTLSHSSSEDVMTLIKQMNPDELFGRMFITSMLELCTDTLEAINTQLKATEKTKAQIDEVINQMQDSIDKIKNKSESDLEYMRQTHSSGLVSEIVNSVGDALNSSCDEIVSIAEGGNQSEAESRINEIVRVALMEAATKQLGQVNSKICQDFAASLDGIDRVMRENQFDEAYVSNLSTKIQTAFTSIQDVFVNAGGGANAASQLIQNSALKIGSKAVGAGILGAASGFVMPVIGILVMFLPEILGLVFGNVNKERARDAIRRKLQGDIFPSIKRKLREELPVRLEEQVAAMIEQVRLKYEQLIEQKSKELEAAKTKQDAEIAVKEQEKATLEAARTDTTSILNSLITIKKSWEDCHA